MVKSRPEIEEIVRRYAEELKKLYIRPERIILYGSFVTGKAREESDIDLIIISEDFKGMNLRERLELLGLAAGRVFEPIEALGYTREEVEEREEGSFLKEAINRGVVTLKEEAPSH